MSVDSIKRPEISNDTYTAAGAGALAGGLGTYGVIGPLRMDYQKVVSVLEGVGKILEDMVNKK